MTGAAGPERDTAVDEADALLDRAAAAFAENAGPRPGDAELLAAAVAGAMRSAPVTRLAPRWSRTRTWMLAAAAVMALAGLASASLWEASRARTAPHAPSPASEPLAAPAPPMNSAPPPAESKTETPTTAPTATTTPIPTTSSTSTAASLFAAANEARRRGDAQAPGFYLDLQHRFPRSPEARLSEVTLGRLYLDRLDDAKSALGQFDAYIAGGEGALSEEALVGRALALGRLGRSAEERGAWQELLDAYPDSISAERARRRLTELP
jgi:TolA-binding protein